MNARMTLTAVLALAMLACAPAIAQQAPKFGPREPSDPPGHSTNTTLGEQTISTADSQIAASVAVDSEAEIALSKVAQAQTKDAEVRKFADMMVREHTDFAKKLNKFMQARPEDPRGEGQIPSAARDAAREAANRAAESPPPERGTSSAPVRPHDAMQPNFIAVKTQISNRCLELVREEWKDKQGVDFDRCYIGQQIGAHVHAQASLEVLAQHASPELRGLLDKGLEMTKAHMKEARRLAAALTPSGAARTAQKD